MQSFRQLVPVSESGRRTAVMRKKRDNWMDVAERVASKRLTMTFEYLDSKMYSALQISFIQLRTLRKLKNGQPDTENVEKSDQTGIKAL